jgi:hypothetical protein
VLGCPADMPVACRGTATMTIRGGRRVLAGRYRIRPGGFGGPEGFFSDRTNRQLVRRDAVVVVKGRDTKGRMQRQTRRLWVFHTPCCPA